MTRSIEHSSAAPPTAHVSPSTLAKASLAALAVAAAVTVLVIIPAETGKDPLGTGEALGIVGMSAADSTEGSAIPDGAGSPAAAAPASTGAAIESGSAWHEEERSIELPPFRGTEMKARMKKGDGYVFSWQVDDGAVMVDMHGDPPNAGPDDFTSYWEQAETTAQQGTFVAPFDGIHGWYWRNLTDKPVTVKLKISGFYEELYKP